MVSAIDCLRFLVLTRSLSFALSHVDSIHRLSSFHTNNPEPIIDIDAGETTLRKRKSEAVSPFRLQPTDRLTNHPIVDITEILTNLWSEEILQTLVLLHYETT
jgi:hypothetical protein